MSALRKGFTVSLPGIDAGSFPIRKKRARHAARTSQAHSTPRMLCVNTHCPSDPGGAKGPSKSVSPTNYGGRQHRPLGNASSTRFSGQQTLQHEFSTHLRALSSATFGSLRCSSRSSNRVLFLSRMLSSRSGPFSFALGCFLFPKVALGLQVAS